jgi:bifunctional non-homologous end joining protein LigD
VGLARYAQKRDFSKTPEPSGKAKRRAKTGDGFCVQKHDATRLHYDLRLELDGVLKSWAVTNGPSLVPGIKRLAVETEDHPLDYADFEGTIPLGQYGGGRVIVWDRGRWAPDGDPHAGLKKGHLKFTVEGEKLAGAWHLVRLKPKGGEKRVNWLLMKADDEHARAEGDPDILEEAPQSVITGRTIEDIERPTREPKRKAQPAPKSETPAPKRTARAAKKADGAKLPDFVPPQLCATAGTPPSGAGWLFEVKYDGYRLQARLDHGRVRLKTRSGLDWTERFGRLAKAAAALPATTALIDGEVVVETAEGASSFAELQAALKGGRDERFVLYAFDLLHLDGEDLADLPLTERKARLASLLDGAAGQVRYSEHFETNGAAMHRHACRLGLEGIVAKRAARPYRSGRSEDWLKIKCAARQEFAVVGYVPSTVSKRAIGSLALATADPAGGFTYVGKVGTGFTASAAEELFRLLDPQRVTTPSARVGADADARGVRWVAPRHVAEVEYRTWTSAGQLRHASFQGLREDKAAEDAVAEPAPKPRKGKAGGGGKPARQPPGPKLTHADRVYWEDAGVTKAGLADYYLAVWEWIAPHVAQRPLSLVRCPDGAAGKCFFQKHAWTGLDAAAITVNDIGDDTALSIAGPEGLVALAQAGVLEIHPWGARIEDVERPDRLIFDLDPGEGVGFDEVERAAIDLRDRLAALGLTTFVKTTGGKGLHVVLPIAPEQDWESAKAFTQSVAESMAREERGRFTAKLAKASRGGRIFVDYLRNGRGATAVAAFSPRARPGAPVSTPLAWDELGTGIGPAHFTVTTLFRRLESLSYDPWQGFDAARQRLPGGNGEPGKGVAKQTKRRKDAR